MNAENQKRNKNRYADRMWTLCQTQTGKENRAIGVLADLEYQAYAPRQGEWGRPAGKRTRKLVERPVFPGYVFVDGVPFGVPLVKPVVLGERLALIPQTVIDDIRDKLMEGGFDREREHRPVFEPGMRVQVTGGPATGMRGVVETLSSNGRYALLQGGDFRHGMLVSVFKIATEDRNRVHSAKSILSGGPDRQNQT